MVLSEVPLVVHIVYALDTGGLENGLVNIINRMPVDRYRHAIICLANSGRFADRLTRPDIQIFELNKPPGNSLSIFGRVRRILKQLQPAIVHTRNLAALEMQLSTLWLDVKRVHGEHGRDVDDLEGRNWKRNLLRKGLRFLVHRYIAVSRDLQRWLVEYLGFPSTKVLQIYNGVDRGRFSRGEKQAPIGLPADFLQPGKIVIGTVGRLVAVKNQNLILEAVAALLEQDASLRQRLGVLLVGDGPLQGELQRTAATLTLQDIVCFAGDRSDIADLLQLMDIFLLPSLAEGISNTVLEAMSSSLPVIATRVGGNPELVEDGVTGRLIPNDDVEALAAAMLELLDNTDLRETMGAAGRKKVEQQFDWDKTVERYMAVYDGLLKKGSEPFLLNKGL